MLRRDFVGACVGVTVATAAASRALSLEVAPVLPESGEAPFLLSVMLWTVAPTLPFDQRLEKVAEAGYHAAELVGEFDNWSKEDYARVLRKKRELSLTFDATSGIAHSLCDPAQRDALLSEIRAKLPVLEQLECKRLILLSGNRVPGLSSVQMHAACVEGLKRAADIAAEKNVELLLENIDPEENPEYFLTSAAEGFRMVRETGNPHAKFLYDFYHEQIAEGNLIAKLQRNISLLGLVHVADVPGRHEPGTGEINYPNIYRNLAELGYTRYVAMEFEPQGDPVPALRAAREMAVKFGRSPMRQSHQEGLLGRTYATA